MPYVSSLRPMTLVEKLMIRPPVRSRLAASRRPLNVPFRFTATRRSNVASSVVAMLDSVMIPALLTRTFDAAELFFSSVEHERYLDRFADIGLRADRTPFARVDFLNERRSFRLAACIVHYDGEAVLRQSACDGAADAAGCSGYDGS